VIRFLAIVVAVALIGYPPFLIYAITVPVAQFRTGSYVDFLTFAGTVFAIYGGVLLGLAVHWARVGRVWQRLRPVEVFKAGVWGALVVSVVFVVGAGVHGLTTQGSFEKGIGNLWGLVLIFALLFGALVSGGMALLFHGFRPSAGASGSVPGNGGPDVRSGRSSGAARR
jgi:hypothetical protein